MPHDYAITITLKPQKGKNKLLTHDQLDDLARAELRLWANSHQQTFQWSLITELTKLGVPHYHGVLRVMSVLPTKYPETWLNLYFNRMFRPMKILGYVLVKYLSNWQTWKDYCLKEVLKTQDLMANYPIMIDECDLLPSYFELLELHAHA